MGVCSSHSHNKPYHSHFRDEEAVKYWKEVKTTTKKPGHDPENLELYKSCMSEIPDFIKKGMTLVEDGIWSRMKLFDGARLKFLKEALNQKLLDKKTLKIFSYEILQKIQKKSENFFLDFEKALYNLWRYEIETLFSSYNSDLDLNIKKIQNLVAEIDKERSLVDHKVFEEILTDFHKLSNSSLGELDEDDKTMRYGVLAINKDPLAYHPNFNIFEKKVETIFNVTSEEFLGLQNEANSGKLIDS